MRAGAHCEAVHATIVGQSQLDLQHVQADEIKVKTQGKSVWMAFSMMVSTRLWLGGAVSEHRDKATSKNKIPRRSPRHFTNFAA